MKKIDELQHRVFDFVTFVTYFLYIVVALGISASAPQYLDDLIYYTKLYVSCFLIYRFNPFRRIKFTSLDAKIGYNAGVFLLLTTIINSVLASYMNLFNEYIRSVAKTIGII
jgi:hypothetical protein